jgi:hypothetical protein
MISAINDGVRDGDPEGEPVPPRVVLPVVLLPEVPDVGVVVGAKMLILSTELHVGGVVLVLHASTV